MSGFVMAIVQLWLEIPAVLGYIRGQAFQRPLSKEEEAACLQRLAEGDEDARDELIERNMRLVAHIVKSSIQSTSYLTIISPLEQSGL